jgi:hypothetical protein
MMMASWNSGGRALKETFAASFDQVDFVVVNRGPDPQQWLRATYWKVLPWVSMRRMGDVARPTSKSRFGADMDDLLENWHAVCFGFATHPWMQRRMKLNVSSEPELIGIWCAVPSVGHGARDAENGQVYYGNVWGSDIMFIQSIPILRIRSDSMSRSRKVRFDNESMSPTRASIYLDDLALPLLSIDAQFDGRFFFQLDVYFGSSAPPFLGERV